MLVLPHMVNITPLPYTGTCCSLITHLNQGYIHYEEWATVIHISYKLNTISCSHLNTYSKLL